MAYTQLRREALRRATQPDVATEHNEVHNQPTSTQTDRAGCARWLQEGDLLRPGEDNGIWENIKRNWIGYLSATSTAPDATLAPNRKAVRFTSGEEGAGEQRRRFSDDRKRRMSIQSAFWNGLDAIEAMTERWPRAARAALNRMDGGEDRGAFESLASVRDLGKRRRYQAVWTSLVGFLMHSVSEGTLEEMGLQLDEDQIDDVLDIEQEVWSVDLRAIARRREKGGFENVWAPIQQLLFKALGRPNSTARNNPLVWWMTVLARSVVSDKEDFIGSGRFRNNPMPMDVDIKGRLGAMVHYSKVLVLDHAFWSLPEEGTPWVMEVQSTLNMVSIEWINDAEGRRPDESSDKPLYSSVAWQVMVAHIKGLSETYLGGRAKTSIYWACRLDKEI